MTATTSSFPLPSEQPGRAVTVVPAPGAGPGFWAGAPAALLDDDGSILLAYRLRHGHDGYDETVVARTRDGERVEPLARIPQDRIGAIGMERPALARADDGAWRLYVCGGTPNSKRWFAGVLEAPTVEGLADAELRVCFPGDERAGVKDPIVRRSADGGWEAWLCNHPLDVDGAEDRMFTTYLTSDDGLAWTDRGTVLAARAGRWDARGARLTCVLPDGRAVYDGRRNAEENWFERTGLARLAGGRPGALEAAADEPVRDLRYLTALPLPDGAIRLWWEARLADESHELRTELVAPGG